MTMLNAHTATRSFRELQYDVKVFLDGIEKISPIEGPQGTGVVELKWADGSIDLVPSTEFIFGIVSRLFPRVTIGNKAELFPDGGETIGTGGSSRYCLNLKISGAGLQVYVSEFGDGTESIVINGGVIESLKADTLYISTGVRIRDMQASGNVHTDYCTMNGGINVRDTLYLGASSNFYTMRLDKVHLENPIRAVSSQMPEGFLSSYIGLPSGSDGKIFGLYTLKHLMNYEDYYDANIQRNLNTNRAHIITKIPIPRLPIDPSVGVVYDYVQTNSTRFPERMDDPFDEGSPASLLTLYPLKTTDFVTRYGTMYLSVVVPEYDNYFTYINNPTDTSIKVCNAWMFVEEAAVTESNMPPGVITPLSYVVLPPYSCVEFLFGHEIKGGNYCAYMMPTTELESN